MKKFLNLFLIVIGLSFVIALERVVGLPIFFLSLLSLAWKIKGQYPESSNALAELLILMAIASMQVAIVYGLTVSLSLLVLGVFYFCLTLTSGMIKSRVARHLWWSVVIGFIIGGLAGVESSSLTWLAALTSGFGSSLLLWWTLSTTSRLKLDLDWWRRF